jgi:hypothetical protein
MLAASCCLQHRSSTSWQYLHRGVHRASAITSMASGTRPLRSMESVIFRCECIKPRCVPPCDQLCFPCSDRLPLWALRPAQETVHADPSHPLEHLGGSRSQGPGHDAAKRTLSAQLRGGRRLRRHGLWQARTALRTPSKVEALMRERTYVAEMSRHQRHLGPDRRFNNPAASPRNRRITNEKRHRDL